MLEDVGSISIDGCDDANIPVNCFLSNEDEDNPGKWVWSAENFMPRKSMVCEGYKLVADTKEEILDAIEKHVVPLYQYALDKIRSGDLYYWG